METLHYSRTVHALKIEKLDEKGFDELVQAMTMADKAFFIDLYRYQESVLLKASAYTAGHVKDDLEKKSGECNKETTRTRSIDTARELNHVRPHKRSAQGTRNREQVEANRQAHSDRNEMV